MKEKARKRMDLKVLPEERIALENLSKLHGVPMTKVIMRLVKNSAKRQGCWPEDRA